MTARVQAPARSGAAGFTLLEMVLALVIFGMIAALVYSAFYFGHRAVVSGERAADDNQRMRLAEDFVGRQLRSAVYAWAKHDEEDIPFFIGFSDGLTFVTSAPQSRGGTGLAVVTYKLLEGKLVVEERANYTADDLYDPPSDARVDRAVLLEGFSALRFEYLPREEMDLGWADKWDARDEDTLPAAVRITVDGLPFFNGQPWVREVPLLTMAYGWGTDEFQEPPDEDTEDDDGDDDPEQDPDPDPEPEPEPDPM